MLRLEEDETRKKRVQCQNKHFPIETGLASIEEFRKYKMRKKLIDSFSRGPNDTTFPLRKEKSRSDNEKAEDKKPSFQRNTASSYFISVIFDCDAECFDLFFFLAVKVQKVPIFFYQFGLKEVKSYCPHRDRRKKSLLALRELSQEICGKFANQKSTVRNSSSQCFLP